MNARRSTWTMVWLILFAACDGAGPDPAPPGRPLGSTDVLEPGEICAEGGVVLSWGLDEDGDGVLSAGEVTGRAVHCDPPAGPGPDPEAPAILTRQEYVESSPLCPEGGTAVHVGADLDGDGVLDDGEITESTWICDRGASPDAEVSTTSTASCAREENGAIWCWGSNVFGQLGLPVGARAHGRVPIAVGNAVQLSGGSRHTCALDAAGVVWCWGYNESGELGGGGSNGPVRQVQGIPPMRSVHALADATCSVDLDGDVWCWGSNLAGLSGGSPSDEILPPTRIAGISRVTAVAGWHHVCAVDEDGALWCWGQNDDAEIREPASETLPITRLDGIPVAASVSAGRDNTCIVDSAGSVTCWGDNFYWKLGDASPQRRPRRIDGLGPATSVAVGDTTVCALLADGASSCWGTNLYGQFGDGTALRRSADPVPVLGISDLQQLSQGDDHVCALSAGRTHCWGRNDDGQAAGVLRPHPTRVLGGGAVVSAGMRGTCAVRIDGSPWCWGSFADASLDGTWLAEPTRMADWRDAVGVGAGGQHACFLREDGSVWCWGANAYGQLGDGTDDIRDTLVRSSVDGAVAIAAGNNYSCAIRSDESLWCWGYVGDFGGLPGSPIPPSQLLTRASRVSLGYRHACAIDRDGVVSCWGENQDGQIGDGTETRREQPVAVFDDAVDVAVGSDDTCALRRGGSRWCWGDGYGDVPEEVDAPGPDTRMASGLGVDCLASGGDLRCRGTNVWGAVGDGTLESRRDYVDVAVRGASDISIQWIHTCALDARGDIWCWGDNSTANIGDGGPAGMVLSPVDAENPELD